MQFRHPQPKNEQDFETLCLKALQRAWACPTLELFGKRGENQYGVDIVDTSAASPLRAAQCKLREPGKKLTTKEIRGEVAKAKQFPRTIHEYYVVTTARRSTSIQEVVAAINDEHRKTGLFSVRVIPWDEIEELIDIHADLRELVYPTQTHGLRPIVEEGLTVGQRTLELVQQLVASGGSLPSEYHDRELEDAKSHLDRGESKVARVLLERLKKQHREKLSAHQRFRLTTNLAVCHAHVNDSEAAASLLLEGADYEPDTEKSRVNRAVAYELRNDDERAYEAAKAAREMFPESARALAVEIRTAPRSLSWSALVASIPESLREDSEIALALAMRALATRQFEDAAAWAERSRRVATQNRPYALVVEGRALLEGEVRAAPGLMEGRPVGMRSERLERAVQILTEAFESTRETNPTLAAEALVHRAEGFELLGKRDDARADLLEAERTSPHQPLVLVVTCERYLEEGAWNDAVTAARRAIDAKIGPPASYLLAKALWKRDRPGDRAEATQLFVRLVSGDEPPFRLDVLEHALRALRQQGRASEGWALLEAQAGKLPETTLGGLRAAFALSLEDRAGASKEADECLKDRSPSDLTRTERRRLAHILVSLGRDQDAVPLLESLQAPGVLTDDTHQLLDSAHRLGRHGVVMRVSRELRVAGVRDRRLLWNELSLCQQYAPLEAVRVLETMLAEDPDDREARLHLSLVGIRLGRDDLTVTDPDRLPTSETVSPRAARAMVELLQQSGRGEAAIGYAYDVLRRHFDDPDAHRAYMAAILWRERSEEVEPPIELPTVGPDCAVRYLDEATGERKWVVVEAPPINPRLHEAAPDHALVTAMSGHRVGDRVVVSRGHAQDRTIVIEEIVHKHVFRFRESMSEWQVRFPNEMDVQMINLAPRDGESGEDINVQPILNMMDSVRGEIERVDDVYRNNNVPLHVLAEAHGRSLVEAFGHVLTSDDLPIRCNPGAPNELARAVRCLAPNATIVADATALLAAQWLEMEPFIEKWSAQILVPHGVMLLLRGHLHELLRGTARHSSRANFEIGPFVERFGDFVRFVEARCQVVDCPELADMDPARREELVKYVGRPSAQAIAVTAAKREDRVLWTDDGTVGLLGAREGVLKRTWTQAILQSWLAAGIANKDEVRRRVAKLLGARYETTYFDVDTVVEAARLADWQPWVFPFKQALDQLVLTERESRETTRLALHAIVGLCSAAFSAEARNAAVVAVLERLARHPEGFIAIHVIERVLPDAFGLNVIRGREARDTVRGWIASKGIRLA